MHSYYTSIFGYTDIKKIYHYKTNTLQLHSESKTQVNTLHDLIVLNNKQNQVSNTSNLI